MLNPPLRSDSKPSLSSASSLCRDERFFFFFLHRVRKRRAGQHQHSHYGEAENVSAPRLHYSALGLMSLSLRRISISNEVANHPIRQYQHCEPVERGEWDRSGRIGCGPGRGRLLPSPLPLRSRLYISSFHLFFFFTASAGFSQFLLSFVSLTSRAILTLVSTC